MPNLVTCLWFNGHAQDAAEFYTSVFPNSRITKVFRSPADYPSGRKGDLLTVEFTLDGTRFTALNGGPDFHFDEAISFEIHCEDQAEVDRYWEALTADGGEPGPCGWLKDRFGLSWQVIPKEMVELIEGPDPAGAERAMQAMLRMGKLDIAELRAAYEGAAATA